MIQFSKGIEKQGNSKEIEEMIETVVSAVNLASMSLFMERHYGKETAKDFFSGLKQSGYYKDAEIPCFEERVYDYFDRFDEYLKMNWNKKPIKRKSFGYKP
jgi:hypothetical protein